MQEMEKLHKDGHEANFILVSDKIKIPDFDNSGGYSVVLDWTRRDIVNRF